MADPRWLAGLDVAAEDVLALPAYYEAPPVMCFLERGSGAAIRRARTRLPGGGANPVALIQIPRERMIGTSVAASLAHETGHQVAALLRLVESLRAELAVSGGRARAGLWQQYLRLLRYRRIPLPAWTFTRMTTACQTACCSSARATAY